MILAWIVQEGGDHVLGILLQNTEILKMLLLIFNFFKIFITMGRIRKFSCGKFALSSSKVQRLSV